MSALHEPTWRSRIPVLTGHRVSVREITPADAQTLFTVVSDPIVARYISAPPPSVTAFMGFIAWAHREREAGRSVCFVVVPHGLEQAVGIFQIRALEPSFRVAEWGFALDSSFWSTGIFEDAATLVADFAFDTLGAHRLEGRAVTVNGRGNGALHKLGATGEAILRSALQREDVSYEQFLWSLTADVWRSRRVAPRPRFSKAAVERDIRDAINGSRTRFRAPAPSGPHGSVDDYPYFVGRGLSPAGELPASDRPKGPPVPTDRQDN